MNTSTTHTEYLVTMHNCVVIEGFGAVLVNRHSAQIHDDGNITPPAATYMFNADVTKSDGLLENSIARAKGISYEQAAAIVRTDSEAMRRQLTNDGHVSLGRIGTVVRNADGVTAHLDGFESDLLSPLASWLPTIRPAIKPSITENVTITTPEKHPGLRVRRWVKAAVAAAAIVAIAVVSSTPITVDNAHYASMSIPTVTGPQTAYVPRTAPAVLDLPKQSEDLTALDTAARIQWQQKMLNAPIANAIERPAEHAQVEAVNKVPENAVLHIDPLDQYCVVIASLTNEDEARQFIAQAQRRHGGNYGYFESAGRWRVYGATANTSAQAANMATKLIAYKGAWVCKLN